MKKYIIFDFDGTLVNTNKIITESWQATFRHYLGHEMPLETIEATFGEVLATSIKRLLPDADVDEVVDYYRAYQDSHHDLIEVRVFDGIKELLIRLRELGCLVGVGTSRTTYSLLNYMRELDMEDMFDEIVTMNDVTRHKPDPETAEAVLLKLMAHDRDVWDRAVPAAINGEAGSDIQIPDEVRGSAVMVGDTLFDVGCAQNAGIDSVLVNWSHYIDEDAMAAHGFAPTFRIDTPAELLEII